MSDFLKAHAATMGDEGGVNFNPADKGNVVIKGVVTIPTYKGIAPAIWPQWGGWKFITGAMYRLNAMPLYGTAAYSDWAKYLNSQLAQLTYLQQLVIFFFRINFWGKYRLGEINDQAVADWLYNHAVNGGGRGVMWMQAAAGVTPDGAVGDKTIAAINAAAPSTLLDKAMDNAIAFRLAKVKADPSQKQFLGSWLERDGVSKDKIKQVMATA